MAYSAEQEAAIIEAVARAQMDALSLSPANRNIILHAHLPHRFVGRPDRPNPERFTNISIYVLPGYTLATKRRLYKRIVEALEPLGIPPMCVLIKLHELTDENTAIRGGQAMCDVDYERPVNAMGDDNG
ncbi:MAG: tautomerase family protein [Burkholderiaceae bacterium]